MRLLTKFQILFALSAMLLTSYARADKAACTMDLVNKRWNYEYAEQLCNSGKDYASCVTDLLQNRRVYSEDAERLCSDKKVNIEEEARQNNILKQISGCKIFESEFAQIECMRVLGGR